MLDRLRGEVAEEKMMDDVDNQIKRSLQGIGQSSHWIVQYLSNS